MLIEHRAYTLKAGCADAFWQAQEDRGYDLIKPILERLIGYFGTASESEPQIIHLYRYDDYDDWRHRLKGLYGVTGLMPYFKKARTLLVAQENQFLVPAPVPALTPHWGNGSEWLPGDRPCTKMTDDLLVEETVITLFPGSLPSYWQAYDDHGISAKDAITANLIGCFVSEVGRQHQVMHYRWFADASARQRWSQALEANDAWRSFSEATAPMVRSCQVKLLKPARFSQLSPLFCFGG